MSISKHFTLVGATTILLLLASADAASETKRFLRRTESANDNSHNERPKRGLKQTKGAASYVLPVASPTAAPVKLRPDLNDWIEDCGNSSNGIQSCSKDFAGTATAAEDCQLCLKALASVGTPPPPEGNGVTMCAKSPACGKCTRNEIQPFYACGLLVDRAFGNSLAVVGSPADAEVDLVPPITDPLDPLVVAMDPLVVVAIDPLTDPAKLDDYHCPALWPGSREPCVMVDGFNRKKCVYHEYSADSICTCSDEQLIWSCVNGPTDLKVEKDDLTVVVGDLVDSSSSTSSTSSTTTEVKPEENPMPITNIDAVISSFP